MVDKTLKSLVGEFIENNGLVKGASSYLLKLTNETQHSHEVFKEFKNIVSEIDSLYPGIDNWFDKKVIPGINNGKRHAFLMMHNGRAIAETIVKFGNDSKLCSMRIKPSFQNYSLGILLFAEVAKALGNKSHSVHFTAPESLTLQRKGLFRRLGFRCIGKSSRIYRKGEDEFVFHASTVEFRNKVNSLLTEHLDYELSQPQENVAVVMSVKPQHAYNIVRKAKTIEIRRKFSKQLEGRTMFVYASKPAGSIVGEGTIGSVIEGRPESIWENYSERIGCDAEEFYRYCSGSSSIKAIVLENVVQYSKPLPWNVFSTTFNAPPRPPQSHQSFTPAGFQRSRKSIDLISAVNDDNPFALSTSRIL